MDGIRDLDHGTSLISANEVNLEEDKDDFRSCCGDVELELELILAEDGDVELEEGSEISDTDSSEGEESADELLVVVGGERDEEEDEEKASETSEIHLEEQHSERDLKEKQELMKLVVEEEGEEVKEDKELKTENHEIVLDEHAVKLYFKGTSVISPGDSGLSGIGVVMESTSTTPMEVQKKLEFFVEQLAADYLALMDGLAQAARNKIRRVHAITDSEILYNQIMDKKDIENPLLMAMRQRILEYANDLELFAIKVVESSSTLARALELAQVAIGVVSPCLKEQESTEICSICCEDKLGLMMMTLKCSHKFCSHCLKAYVEGKVESAQVPIRCPHLSCKYYVSAAECKSFLPVFSYLSLETMLVEANVLNADKVYCPYPNCSVLLDPHKCFSIRASSSDDSSCVECTACQRFVCVDCRVPWHPSMTCEEYQNIMPEERDIEGITLHRPAQNPRWRICLHCQRMIELTHGCHHIFCLCGHEFCFSCGGEYRNGRQSCECALWAEDYNYSHSYNYNYNYSNNSRELAQQFGEHWAWDSFESLPMIMDAYSDEERSQLELIQRFLAGGFSLTTADHQSPTPPPHSYTDPMKDLHQLPWLERFVSLINDNNYYEDIYQ
ncbi:unnamed protein product [Cuscuta epithymum]|uniref:RBR-type E3 ubiquitin transferase n=1 Tax=Cuscuta epithymum TaxID=186058 RepID=A0AAV0FZZ4_9ASTE|nr:unnamed protein product [Cuscuta epithymum]